jgi:hypothetical protein
MMLGITLLSTASIYVLIYTLLRLTGNWLYLYNLYCFLCLGLLLTKWNFPISHTQTLRGVCVSPWKNKSNIQPPFRKNVKASGQIDNGRVGGGGTITIKNFNFGHVACMVGTHATN